MNLDAIQRRIQKVEQAGKRTVALTFSPGDDGVIPDEYEPDTDTLVCFATYCEDKSVKQPDNKLFWRGDEYSPENLPGGKSDPKSATGGEALVFKTIYQAKPSTN